MVIVRSNGCRGRQEKNRLPPGVVGAAMVEGAKGRNSYGGLLAVYNG